MECTPSVERPKRLTLFTLNILCEKHNLDIRMHALGELIEKEKPDIIAFQENMETHNDLLLSNSCILVHLSVRLTYVISANIISCRIFMARRKVTGFYLLIISGFKVSLWSRIPFSNLRLSVVCNR